MNPLNKQPGKTPRREKTTLSSNSGSREKLKDPVHVYCRLRPLKDERGGESTCIKVISPTTLCLCTPAESKQIRKDVYYNFKHIFTAYADQKEVFDHVAYPLIEDLLHAKNGLLFTYGVTGSGKTYTLTGEPNNPGIMPRSIYTIFNTIQEFQANKFIIKSDHMNGFEIQSENDALQERFLDVKSGARNTLGGRKGSGDTGKIYVNDGSRVLGINENNLYAVFVNYIEIYNNIVYDLLDEAGGKTLLQSKILREDADKNMYVSGVVEIEVKSAAEAFEVFNMGQRRKRMGHTTLNAESSRSHSIFNIRVVQLEQVGFSNNGGEQRPTIPEQNLIKVGQLSLVDLAGSERCSRTQNTGLRLKEASSINNSLMSLRTCLETLRDNQLNGTNRLVPYRDSRLTLFFKNYFEGHGRIEMIVCLNPSIQDFEENLQVVKFAEVTQDVKISKPEVRYTPCKKVVKKLPITPSPAPAPKKLPNTPSFSLPKIPSIKLNFDDPDSCSEAILKLIKILHMRREKSKIINKEIANKEQHFRKRLVEINQENMLSKSEIKSLKTVLRKERQKVENHDTKITDLEIANNNLIAKQRELEEVIRGLRNTIDEKDLKINQNVLEREKIKQKQAQEAVKMSRELEEKLRKQRHHLQAEMLAKENKLQKMREVLDCNLYELPQQQQQQTIVETELIKTPEKEHRRSLTQPPSSATRRRRSRSAGEVWLEHNVIKPVPLGTVMQPTMKKRKSITKLCKAKDVTNPKQNKYCLIAQETDTDGEVETKLYKADIVPTCGGGAQVVFNDVERLRQQSPTAD